MPTSIKVRNLLHLIATISFGIVNLNHYRPSPNVYFSELHDYAIKHVRTFAILLEF
jgi:hypothetical protein